MLSSESTATVTWKIPEGTEDGTYMIWNYGDYKHLTGGTVPFTGHSSESIMPTLTLVLGSCHSASCLDDFGTRGRAAGNVMREACAL